MPEEEFTSLIRRMLFSRPTVMGVTEPGKRTEVRSARMGITSGMEVCSDGESVAVTMGMILCRPSNSSGRAPMSSTSMVSILSFLLIGFSILFRE